MQPTIYTTKDNWTRRQFQAFATLGARVNMAVFIGATTKLARQLASAVGKQRPLGVFYYQHMGAYVTGNERMRKYYRDGLERFAVFSYVGGMFSKTAELLGRATIEKVLILAEDPIVARRILSLEPQFMSRRTDAFCLIGRGDEMRGKHVLAKIESAVCEMGEAVDDEFYRAVGNKVSASHGTMTTARDVFVRHLLVIAVHGLKTPEWREYARFAADQFVAHTVHYFQCIGRRARSDFPCPDEGIRAIMQSIVHSQPDEQ